eukprot:2990518-Rhodomonas_salina.1
MAAAFLGHPTRALDRGYRCSPATGDGSRAVSARCQGAPAGLGRAHARVRGCRQERCPSRCSRGRCGILGRRLSGPPPSGESGRLCVQVLLCHTPPDQQVAAGTGVHRVRR